MKQKSKRYRAIKEKVSTEPVSVKEAIETIQSHTSQKFDESLEVHIRLGIDPKNSEQIVRGILDLPHGTGRSLKVAVFTETKQKEAAEAKADIVGGKELVEEIAKSEKTDFDAAIATPDFMRDLAKIAKILGTRGLMPSPKNNSITEDIKTAVEKLKAGQVQFRNDDSGNMHQILGKASWDTKKLVENIEKYLTEIKKHRPKGVKGAFMQTITLCSTMGPGIKITV